MFRRQFRANDELNPRRGAGRRHAGATLDGVMVGQRQRLVTKAHTMPHDFLRREGAIGEQRMEMEVGEHLELKIKNAKLKNCR
jgi:hypothetical protein